MRNFVIEMGIFLSLVSCATTGPTGPEFQASRVIERIGNLDKTPDWATGQKAFSEESGQVLYINTVSMSGDSRPEACANAAADQGRSQILRQIKDNLTASGQLSELSASNDPAVESLLAFLSQGQLSGVKATERYWERREESDAGGQRVLRINCSAKVAISKSLLEKQIAAVINGAPTGNPEIRAKLLEAQKGFISNVGKGTAESAQVAE